MEEQTATKFNQVQIQQNKSLKILFDKDYYTPTKELHRELSLLQVQEIFQTILSQVCIKTTFVLYTNNNIFCLPDIFDTYFTNNNKVHQHNKTETWFSHKKTYQ